MYNVTIDCISVKEIDNLCRLTGRDVWNDASFDSKEDAEKFRDECKKIAPLAYIEIE